ncbi:NUDIX hydrolase [Nocardioides caldifontis]|uniref:NUDIX hydrolase n=1 Tax=Nocardioides caldifontis TaxID=2588938 RepID=UPI001396C6E4|nr:NUDIX hydrolase [Nocardioides caldifontis]
MTPEPSRIRRVRSRLQYADEENPYVRVYYDEVEWPDGRRGRYNRVVEGAGVPGVAVLPLVGGGVGLVQVDRYPVGMRLWEVPRGFGEGEPEADARRELLEETGWSAIELIDLGQIYLNSGLLAGHVRLFAAKVDGGAALAGARDDEAVEVAVLPVDTVRSLLEEGSLPDAVTQAVILQASLRGLLDLKG